MKKKTAIILAAVLAAALLAACAQPQAQNDDMAALQEQMAQLTSEIAELKTEVEQARQPAQPAPEAPAPEPPPSASSEPASSAPAAEPPPASAMETPPASAADYDLPGLTERVNAMVAKMETATQQTMFDTLFEAKELERDIDIQDDAVERDYRQGLISRDDYRSIERELEYLEEQLDWAEDGMERRLGFDD